jgi:subfamily B ATP-binding cassette protein MsbA
MYRDLSDRFGALTALITEAISSQELIRVFAREEDREGELRKEISDYLSGSLKLHRFTNACENTYGTILYILLPIFALYVSIALLHQKLTVGQIVAAYGIWGISAMPAGGLFGLLSGLSGSVAGIGRIFEFFDETPLIHDSADAAKLEVGRGEIRLSNISFTYPLRDTKIVLNGIDLIVPARSKTALVGATGSGKSTIVSLVLRLYDPDTGTVCIDNQSLRTITQQSIRENIGLVMQETILRSGSIRDNLTFARPEATEEQMRAALRNAELLSFVDATKDKLDTVVGERGVKLSGGQKQRLAIARVFLVNPPIVILDEATSSLDSITERSIQGTMNGLFHGRTTLIIAHRLSTVVDCNPIVVMDNGMIIANGSHRDLYNSCDKYREMCSEQRLSGARPA